MATMKKARVLQKRKALNRPELQRGHADDFMWSMKRMQIFYVEMTKLKHVQQAAADLTIPTE